MRINVALVAGIFLGLWAAAAPLNAAQPRVSAAEVRETQRKLADTLRELSDWGFAAQWEQLEGAGTDPSIAAMPVGTFHFAKRSGESTSLWTQWDDGTNRPMPSLSTLSADAAFPEKLRLIRSWSDAETVLEYSAIHLGKIHRSVSLRRGDWDPTGGHRIDNPNSPVRPFDGYLFGDFDSIHRILANTDALVVHPTTERVGNADCLKVEAKTPGGTYTAWLDPAVAYQPRRVSVVRGPTDMYFGKLLWSSVGGKGAEDRDVTQRMHVEWDDFQDVHGVPLPKRMRFESVIDFAKKPDRPYTITATRDLFETSESPEFDLWNQDIPNGTPGIVTSSADGKRDPINYVWQDNSLIRYLDPAKTSAIDTAIAPLQRPVYGDQSRWWWTVSGTALVVLALGLFVLFLLMRARTRRRVLR